MKNAILNIILNNVVILIFSSVSFASLMHPSIVGAPTGYSYKTVLLGDPVYINDQDNKQTKLVLETLPAELGFNSGAGVRLIQTSQLHKNSDEKVQMLTLRSAFIPNFAIAYNEVAGTKIPHWLKKDFIATKLIITTSDRRTGRKGPDFRVYEYVGTAKQVNLGGNGKAQNMYLILVRSGRSETLRR